MKAILGFQEIVEIVEDGYSDLTAEANEQQRLSYKENRRKDCKAMCLLHQCIDEAHFEKIAATKSSQEAWRIMEKCNKGAEQLKKVKLHTMRRKYELMQMEPSEKVAQFFNRIISHTNAMKAYGEMISDLKVEELQGSLEAHEQRLIERATEKPIEQALQAQTSKKGSYYGMGDTRNRGRDQRERNSSKDQERLDSGQSMNFTRRGGNNSWREGKRKIDRKKIKCFNCNKVGHFSNECQTPSSQAAL
ncbi:PREDICTED: uncharacterized protein LOC109361916 [Lupinus angustifolius]|uniref:uncharacterized protein LOC109361916 n=1 Tax=Lupinus angustifolius TaxID=3871 RepID=UPI00092FD161|nr:PREDICTED: uncharacterized protein LOC109361916 [Lupinus angustifolius]